MDEFAKLVGLDEAENLGQRGQHVLREVNRRGGRMELPIFVPPSTEAQKTSNVAVLVLVGVGYLEQVEKLPRRSGNCEYREHVITEEGRNCLERLGR